MQGDWKGSLLTAHLLDNPWNVVIATGVATVIVLAFWAAWPMVTHRHKRHKFIVGLVRRLADDSEAHVFPGRGPRIDSLLFWNEKTHDLQKRAGRKSYAYGWTNEFNLSTLGDGYALRVNGVLSDKRTPYRTVLVVYRDPDNWFFVTFDGEDTKGHFAEWDGGEPVFPGHRLGAAKLFPPER